MNLKRQASAPLYEAIERFRKKEQCRLMFQDINVAEELTADAFGAEHAFFMVGGTTQAVQNMVLSVCKAGDEIIVPRNVHKSGSMSRFSTS